MVIDQTDRQSVIERLRALEQQFTEIIDLVGDNRVLRGVAKEKAQRLLRTLKDNLQSEYKRMSTIRGEQSLSPLERAFYKPAVDQSHAEVRVRVNSIPGDEWGTNLYGARINVSHLLYELEHPRQ